MNDEQNLAPSLDSLSLYSSPLGGAPGSKRIAEGCLYFEIITDGSVMGFERDPLLHGESTVFCHHEGQRTIHKSPADSFYSCVVIRYQDVTPASYSPWPRDFRWTDRQSMHAFTDEMLHAFHYAGLDHAVIGNLIWSRLALELERFKSQSRAKGVNPQLYAATNYINANYARSIGIEDIAAAAGISESHLYMLFRNHLQESPHQYLIQKRMRTAGYALVTTDLPIKAIADDVGYPNTENFCRAFKSFFGKSASQYRQAYLS